ncbi:hypothetical protein [Nocardia tengchongensis]|uniref:hypothetical protein n=1 Tax=Nocardia tengchongensis TaxID=2055889 RepID=UPI0036C787C7
MTDIDWDDVYVESEISTPVRDSGQTGPGISWWHGRGLTRTYGEGSDGAGEPVDRTILRMNGIVVDRWTARNCVYEALDAISVDYEKLAAAVFETDSNDLRKEVEDLLEMPAARVVFIDRASLEPRFRGRGGIGRVLIGHILSQLMGDVDSVAVTYPHPFELEHGDPSVDIEVRKVRQVWESIGFTPVDDDVWIMDSASTAHSKAIASFEGRLGI